MKSIDLNKRSLLGIDVGFSAKRPTTGIAWVAVMLPDKRFENRPRPRESFDWLYDKANLPGGLLGGHLAGPKAQGGVNLLPTQENGPANGQPGLQLPRNGLAAHHPAEFHEAVVVRVGVANDIPALNPHCDIDSAAAPGSDAATTWAADTDAATTWATDTDNVNTAANIWIGGTTGARPAATTGAASAAGATTRAASAAGAAATDRTAATTATDAEAEIGEPGLRQEGSSGGDQAKQFGASAIATTASATDVQAKFDEFLVGKNPEFGVDPV
jgi:hypothetical protein